jgi:hypothetical protein
MPLNTADPEAGLTPQQPWRALYKIGAAAALVAFLAALGDIIVTFIPGTGVAPGEMTVQAWYALYQANPLLGLRNLGIVNVITTITMSALVLALLGVHRRHNLPMAALAALFQWLGAAVYVANNIALPMLTLSRVYAAATSEAQRSLLVAAGQALLAHEDLTPGVIMGFLLAESAGILMNSVILSARVLPRSVALIGLLGESLLLIFNILAAFVPDAFNLAMLPAMAGGILMLIWLVLVARALWRHADN